MEAERAALAEPHRAAAPAASQYRYSACEIMSLHVAFAQCPYIQCLNICTPLNCAMLVVDSKATSQVNANQHSKVTTAVGHHGRARIQLTWLIERDSDTLSVCE
ncbi:hypothetical protein EVAR_57725_1 [Eumeta japonica]|uniref:Uncharacterized protein n=1 Tax=Eumeta variegata TaxID=151549 RepID=A0A4C1Y535_EUMVA|nr:hypothetical protein EVAR_57725_1 [Eumeta japonica]